jgi:hypothetical protein
VNRPQEIITGNHARPLARIHARIHTRLQTTTFKQQAR